MTRFFKTRLRPLFPLIFAFLPLLPHFVNGEITVSQREFFENRIRPVLAQDCYECHQSTGKRKGGLALDHRLVLLEGGDSGKAILPGDPEASLLVRAIRHLDDHLKMPKAGAKLEDSVIADFERWIAMGAPDPRDKPPTPGELAEDQDWNAVMERRKNWWSFQPIRNPAPPDVEGVSHPVDAFITKKLMEAGLKPSPRADRQTLLRRLSYALRGVPPSPEEVKAAGKRAFVDWTRLWLDSPRFGERWARHWMDWFRYADSHGSEGDPMIPYAWRYRDYLIRALNADVPYDQLVREHIAGDLLPSPRIDKKRRINESALGTGHLRMVFHGFAPTDALDEQVRFTNDQIDVVSKAVLGLTVSCARCHNHKFDPISQADFYGWYGIFASCPPAIVAVDAPGPETESNRRRLKAMKAEIRQSLAKEWLAAAGHLETSLSKPSQALKKHIDESKGETAILRPFREGAKHAGAVLGQWRERVGRKKDSTNTVNWNLASEKDLKSWVRDGGGVSRSRAPGVFDLHYRGDHAVRGVYPAGVYSHLITSKDRGVLMSPRFFLDKKYDLWLRIVGDGGAMTRYAVQNYPRNGTVYPVHNINGGNWQWRRFNLDYWKGDHIHVEISTAADQAVLADTNATRSWFGVRQVLIRPSGSPGPGEPEGAVEGILVAFRDAMPENQSDLAKGYARALRTALEAWTAGPCSDGQAELIDAALRLDLLPNRLDQLASTRAMIEEYRALENALPTPVRAPGVLEKDVIDQPLFSRGNHKQALDPVPRRFLDVIDPTPYSRENSGRLELAEDMLRPDNPLTARVIVNRLWHHLFGHGIVSTPDNFGRLGRKPTHPELLDYLASRFVEGGYSIKDMLAFLVLSETWRRSSVPTEEAQSRDPDNRLLSHFGVRRLEAEAIRDTMLAVSGELRLDEDGGAPVSGGTPRRSVYVRVKRNDLDPLLTVFDAPVPASTVGQRNQTNVPGQSLALLNSGFVSERAARWAERVGAEDSDPQKRIENMFVAALGRSPDPKETDRAQKFVNGLEENTRALRKEREEIATGTKQFTKRLQEMNRRATDRVLAERKRGGKDRVEISGPRPFAAWDFSKGLEDQIGQLHAQKQGGARLENGALVLNGRDAFVATAPLTRNIKAKTLEAWVRLDNLKQKGGGVMSLQGLDGGVFDSIVIGEQQPGHWMAGSNVFARTRSFDGPRETRKGPESDPVHIVISYAGDGTITGYRNGKPYGKTYRSNGPVTFEAGKSQVLFGNRHGPPDKGRLLAGSLFRAALYDRALSAEDVAALASGDPNYVSENDRMAALGTEEKQEIESLRDKLKSLDRRRKELEAGQDSGSPWAGLAHALFNFKEFIYIR